MRASFFSINLLLFKKQIVRWAGLCRPFGIFFLSRISKLQILNGARKFASRRLHHYLIYYQRITDTI